jgi:L-Ala-D/L-Glu epimerase
MKLNCRPFELRLAHKWTIASQLGPGGGGGAHSCGVVFVQLTEPEGCHGLGEAAPSSRYHDTPDSTMAFLNKVEPSKLSFADIPGSMEYLESLSPADFAAKGALNVALLDGAARHAGQSLSDFLGLGFTENKHLTSFSIGISDPALIREKVLEAAPYPVLKLKLGSPQDRLNLGALREAAPGKRVRVDANEAWQTKEEALRNLEWLASLGCVEFVEQPMPATTSLDDLLWLKSRSPLPLMADESCLSARDLETCANCFHSVNVKLMKTGGITSALDVLRQARTAGLQTMLGCMIESSLLISAAAHLAELTDFLDLDGNLLITNDPYRGVSTSQGVLSFASAPDATGLRIQSRAG